MRKLEVYIEEDGDFVLAGQIQGETWEDARFIYEKSYLENQSHQPISISLPFQEDAFSPFETRWVTARRIYEKVCGRMDACCRGRLFVCACGTWK
mgnify:CR=1 FL=1